MVQAQNPFFEEFNTLHGTVPFSQIQNSHYEEAVDRGITLAQQEIDAIVNQRSRPTFENTIVALENVGKDLNRVLGVFYPMMSAMSDNELMNISLNVSAKISEYSTNISLNERLWQRVREVYEMRNKLKLDAEDQMLLQRTYDSFARSGALLEGDAREQYRALNAELSELTE